MYDVVVLTDERYANPTDPNEYVKNVMKEDKLVMDALAHKGLRVRKAAWSDPDFDWSKTRYALFRTTWDYAERFQEFADWLMEVSTKTQLINSYDLISWNLDKHYLDDLRVKGVNIVETYFIEPKDSRSLMEIHKELGWEKTVLKPAVSAAAKDTFRLNSKNIEKHNKDFRRLIEDEAMMLQPFQDSVVDRGELSLMVVGGEYTHAVKKIAKDGDFRVQDDFGGTVHEYEPTKAEKELAVRAINVYDGVPAYARVDIIEDNNGQPAIMELELVEPEMWFRRNPKSAEKLAEVVANLF